MLGTIRSDAVSVALLVHVVGAMVLVGGLVTAAAALVLGWRDGTPRLLRIGYVSLLALALPGWIVMRIGAQWTESEENLPEAVEDQAWLGIGYLTADLGGLLLLVGLVAGGIGVRRLRDGGGTGLLRVSTLVSVLLVAAYVVTVWAMAGKPA
jgi:hypothetical protein